MAPLTRARSHQPGNVPTVLSIPTLEHYLPLLYVLGTRQEGESTMFPIEGVDGGSISMLAVRVGH